MQYSFSHHVLSLTLIGKVNGVPHFPKWSWLLLGKTALFGQPISSVKHYHTCWSIKQEQSNLEEKEKMGIPLDIMHWNIRHIDVWIFQFSSMFWQIIALRTEDLKKKKKKMLDFCPTPSM